MDLQNGYKVIYESRTFASEVLTRHLKAAEVLPVSTDNNVKYRTQTGEEISAETLASYKLVYAKNGSIYGSTSSTPTANDTKILVYAVKADSTEVIVLGVEERVKLNVSCTAQSEINKIVNFTPATGVVGRSALIKVCPADTTRAFKTTSYLVIDGVEITDWTMHERFMEYTITTVPNHDVDIVIHSETQPA